MNPSTELSALKNFVMKGNVVDIAVGTIISTAFGGVVSSLVKDVFSPMLGLVQGNALSDNFYVVKAGPKGPYKKRKEAEEDGAVVVGWGSVADAALNFLLQAVCLFFVVRTIHHAKRAAAF